MAVLESMIGLHPLNFSCEMSEKRELPAVRRKTGHVFVSPSVQNGFSSSRLGPSLCSLIGSMGAPWCTLITSLVNVDKVSLKRIEKSSHHILPLFFSRILQKSISLRVANKTPALGVSSAQGHLWPNS